jgi:hypothetical protein
MKLKENIRKNSNVFILAVIVLAVVFIVGKFRNDEFDDLNVHGYTVEGKIIKLESPGRNGCCYATISYTTINGVEKIANNILHKDSNCVLGKTVKLQYSLKSDLTNVVE